MVKGELGQFYTTHFSNILKGINLPTDDNIQYIEPFAGNGDLLQFVGDASNVECYDIDPKKEFITKKDTLLNPPDFTNKFVITNPPYLARNKAKDKTIFDKYDCNDLYKCFMKILISSDCIGGILIIPLNFISSIRKADIELRKQFIGKYNIEKINIFEEQVFDDTSTTVCSFKFSKTTLTNSHDNYLIKGTIYPYDTDIEFSLTNTNNYTLGGEIYNLNQSRQYKIERATSKTTSNITNILLKCIDDTNKIGLRMVEDSERHIDNTSKLSERSYATLVITPMISKEKQMVLVEKFNEYLNLQREKYNSLFLSSYREYSRKRISFQLAFQICSNIIDDI